MIKTHHVVFLKLPDVVGLLVNLSELTCNTVGECITITILAKTLISYHVKKEVADCIN